jgi:hypothetical protein
MQYVLWTYAVGVGFAVVSEIITPQNWWDSWDWLKKKASACKCSACQQSIQSIQSYKTRQGRK